MRYRKLSAEPQGRPAPTQKGFRVGGMKEETWNRLMKDTAAKEFVTFHSEMMTGGFVYFYNRHVGENGSTFIVRRSQNFVLKYAPGHYKLFAALTEEGLAQAKSGNYTQEFEDALSLRYKQFSAPMEKEIEGNYNEARGNVQPAKPEEE